MGFLCALAALCLTTHVAYASEDAFGAGDGHYGDFTASALGTTPNSAASVQIALAVGATSIEVDDASAFQDGDLVLVWQSTGIDGLSSGDATSVDLAATNVGHYELARVAQVTLDTLELTDPLLRAYPAADTQVVFIPEFATLTIPSGTSLAALPWDTDRRTGGVLAVFVLGVLENGGKLDAIGAGMSGGASAPDTSSTLACSSLDQASPGGAARGEGIANDATAPAETGRGNLGNGGGGGVCFAAGGGGGGHGGAGGQGGRSDAGIDSGRNVGGLGGVTLSYASLLDRLTLGAGGGAGHGVQGSSGGNGGGVIFVRAGSITGSGSMDASGGNASDATSDGSGGGGAGGSVLVQAAAIATCALAADGGSGGDGAQTSGTGGGGGGGRTLAQHAIGTCNSSVLGGAAGLDPGLDTQLAAAGAVGLITANTGVGLIVDHDGDGLLDAYEGLANPDGDMLLAYLDADDDDDGVATLDEDPNNDGDPRTDDTDSDLLANYLDDDDDGDGVGTLFEDLDHDGTAKNDHSDFDPLPDYLDDDDDGDGVPTKLEAPDANGDHDPADALNTDGNSRPNYLDSDDDGDLIQTADEQPDPNMDRNPADARQTDTDGIADYLDNDDDGDGIRTKLEDRNVDGNPSNDNSDIDLIPDFLDADDDGDGVRTRDEAPDPNLDGNPADARDVDGDLVPDYLDTDDDGDGITTVDERPGNTDPNLDDDLLPDYLDADDDGDGVPTLVERELADPNFDDDTLPDYRDADDDDDGVDSRFEDADGNGNPRNDDSDGDGKKNYLDTDDDGDGILTELEAPDVNEDGDPADARDDDLDAISDYLDRDDDGDGIDTVLELGKGGFDDPRNSDGDTLPDYRDADDDGDGVKTKYERASGEIRDSDIDQVPDYLDDDDDADSILTKDEKPDPNGDGNPKDALDSDKDKQADFIDDDDDADAIETRTERTHATTWGSDIDKDGKKNWLDTDSDGDSVLDKVERLSGGDLNNDGKPDYLDAKTAPVDTDHDGLSDDEECPEQGRCLDTDDDNEANYADEDDDGDGISTVDERLHGASVDTDDDGVPDFLDADDDNDSVPTRDEVNGNVAADTDDDKLFDHFDADDDGDGIPTSVEAASDEDDVDDDGIMNWRDLDSDGDSVADADEGVTDDNDNGVPAFLDPIEAPEDLDEDGVPDVVECPDRDKCVDTDDDGTPNLRDDDDDGDGIATLLERPEGRNDDSDDDGVTDYLDADDDGDKVPTALEQKKGKDVDTDGDGTLDRFDSDDDDDSVETEDEYRPGHVLDTDGDGKPDHLDGDDDGDGISTKEERRIAKRYGEDLDGDGVPNFLDDDSDADGVPDSVEGHKDTDGDGRPDSLTQGGIAGGALCSALPGHSSSPAWPMAMSMLCALGLLRRRRRNTRAASAITRRAVTTSFALLAFVQLDASVAHATPGAVLDQYRPAAISDDVFGVTRPITPGHLRFETRLSLDYANDPLVYESNGGLRKSERSKLVSDQLAMNLGVSLGLANAFLVYAALPVNLVMNGEELGTQPTATGFGANDMSAGGRLVFLPGERASMGFGLDVTIPTGERGTLGRPSVAREAGLTVTPSLIAEVTASIVRFTFNLGVRLRKDVKLPIATFGNELTYGLAVSLPLASDVLYAHVTAVGATPSDDFGRRASSPLETLLGLTLRANQSWSFGLAGGMGLLRGYGSPDFRAVATSAFRLPDRREAPPVKQELPHYEEEIDEPTPFVAATPAPAPTRDSDNDGMPDPEDQCPVIPGPVDLGGCPEHFQYTDDTGLLVWNTPLRWRSRQAVLEPSTRPLLEDLARALTQNQALQVVIEVHVLPHGDAAQGLKLSMDRAKALTKWLLAQQIEASRIEAYGCGGNRPTAPITGREAGTNDRTEVYVVRPLPKLGMPSTLGCQAVELPSE